MRTIIKQLKTFLKNKLHSIRAQVIMALLLLIIIPTTITSYISNNKAMGSITRNTITSLKHNIHTFERNLTSEINAIDYVVTQFYLDQEVLDILSQASFEQRYNRIIKRYDAMLNTSNLVRSTMFDNSIRSYMGTLDLKRQNSVKLYVYRGGVGIYKFSTNVFELDEIIATDWYAAFPNSGKYHLLYIPKDGSYPNNPNGLHYVRRLYGLKNYNMHFVALITVELSIPTILDALSHIKPTQNSHLHLVDTQGLVIASTHDPYNHVSIHDILSPAVYDTITPIHDDDGVINQIIESENMLYSSTRILDQQWMMIVETPLHEINSDIIDLKNLTRFIVLSVLIIGLIIAFILARKMTEPIYLMVDSMSKLDADNLYVEIKDYKGSNEFAYLIDHYNKTNKKIRKLIKQLSSIEKGKKQAELEALQAQINPHFLYNTLDAVNWMAMKHQAKDISTLVTSLSDFFRYSLSKGKNMISLQDELKQTGAYLTIQKTRFPDMLDFLFQIEEDVLSCHIIKLTLQPLVENAIIHGIEPLDAHGIIKIIGKREKNHVVICIEDNGFGADIAGLNHMLKEPIGKGAAYGIKNVNNRLKHAFGEKYGLYYKNNEDGGVTAVITIPYDNKETIEHV